MLELNVTNFVNNEEPTNFSNSVANSGLKDIGRITWNSAKGSSISFVTEDNKQEFIDYFAEYGAWDDLEDWPVNELNGLFIQELSSQINETEGFETYEEYKESEQVSSNFFKTEDNQFYFTLSH